MEVKYQHIITHQISHTTQSQQITTEAVFVVTCAKNLNVKLDMDIVVLDHLFPTLSTSHIMIICNVLFGSNVRQSYNHIFKLLESLVLHFTERQKILLFPFHSHGKCSNRMSMQHSDLFLFTLISFSFYSH
jgi:hypothetical protein